MGEDADDSGFVGNESAAQFEFEILRVNLPRFVDKIDAVGDLRH
jgi:hypothetical protein